MRKRHIKFVKSRKSQLFYKIFECFLHYIWNSFVYLHIEIMFDDSKEKIMKSLGYLGAFLGGAIAGAALGILVAPEKGQDTRVKITDAVEDFLKKHNIKLSRKEVGDLIDDIQDAAEEE